MSREELSKHIDQTLLNPLTTEKEVIAFCQDAMTFGFRSVCIPPSFVKTAFSVLVSSDVDVCTVIGFPLGYSTTKIKALEIQEAINSGAYELDIVINQGLLKEKRYDELITEMTSLTKLIHKNYCLVKWIVETANLNKSELTKICNICIEVEADFIKTSTGFASQGAQLEHVELWKSIIKNNNLKIKASGGIKTRQDALKFIQSGADRLGCSSGIEIIKENK